MLPPKRAQTSPSLFLVAYSSDAHFLYVSYVTPGASFGVLDPLHRTVLSEIDTAGCMLVIPSGPNRVSSICESGRLLTVTLDAQGREASRTLSAPFFDPDKDPVFVQGIRTPEGYAFLSFLGEVHEIDFRGAQPVFAPPWSLVSAAEQGHWRPGAAQVGAIHRALDRLYVPMHQGGEGTHKDGGTEIWVFDVASHRRLARWPVEAQGLVAGTGGGGVAGRRAHPVRDHRAGRSRGVRCAQRPPAASREAHRTDPMDAADSLTTRAP